MAHGLHVDLDALDVDTDPLVNVGKYRGAMVASVSFGWMRDDAFHSVSPERLDRIAELLFEAARDLRIAHQHELNAAGEQADIDPFEVAS